MQGEVGWDPSSIRYIVPWQTRLFVLYLLVVLVVVVWKSVALVWQLWFFSINRRDSFKNRKGEGQREEDIVSAALADRLQQLELKSGEADFLALLRKGERRFQYLWQTCWAGVMSLKRLVVLTFLLALLAFLSKLGNDLTLFSSQKLAGIGLIGGSIVEALVLLEIGVIVCAVLYLVCGFFEAVLVRRKAAWDYAFTKARAGKFTQEPATTI